MAKSVYIAGKISSDKRHEREEIIRLWNKFERYADQLKETDSEVMYTHGLAIHICKQCGGGEPKACCGYLGIEAMRWEDYMKEDIRVMMDCDEVHMLPDWRESRGASLERDIAIRLGMKVIYVE